MIELKDLLFEKFKLMNPPVIDLDQPANFGKICYQRRPLLSNLTRYQILRNSVIGMMQTAKDRLADDFALDFNLSTDRRVLVQRHVRPAFVIIRDELIQLGSAGKISRMA